MSHSPTCVGFPVFSPPHPQQSRQATGALLREKATRKPLYSSSSRHLQPPLSGLCRQASWAFYWFSFQDFLFFNTYLFGCIGSSLRHVNSRLQHVGSSSLSQDPRPGSLESWPLELQGSPSQTSLEHSPWNVSFSKTPNSWKSGALTLKTLVPPMSFKSPFWNGWLLGLLIPKPVPFTAVQGCLLSSGGYQGPQPNCKRFRPLQSLLG